VLGDEYQLWRKKILNSYSLKKEERQKMRKEKRRRKQVFDVVERMHEAETPENVNQLEGPRPAHRLVVTLESNEYTEEKYNVYENYQRVVHREGPEDISKQGFKRFLCDSPLSPSIYTDPAGGEVRKVGSFHQMYRLDGELVAVGVLDLLPDAISSVYFMYTQSFNQWNPGKLGALREIALCKEGKYKYYMMGYYIHGCQKMKYKAKYRPQQVLDSWTYDWGLLDKEERGLAESEEEKGSRELDEQREQARQEKLEKPFDEDASLFTRDMPGILTKSGLLEHVDLDNINLRLSQLGIVAKTSDLVIWEDESQAIDDGSSIKGAIAELAAAVGADLIRECEVVF
jgi:arginine-tRNA-protein transferase